MANGVGKIRELWLRLKKAVIKVVAGVLPQHQLVLKREGLAEKGPQMALAKTNRLLFPSVTF